jgi:hypothetical protein
MNDLNDLSSSLRDRLPQILGVGVLVLVVAGEMAFTLTRILPAMRTNSELSSQLAEARQALSPPASEAQMQAMLQAQLSTLQQALNEQADAFLAEAEVPVVLSHLYRYADESGVQIAQIEAAQAAGSKKTEGAAHDTQSFQVTVSGPTLQLVGFVTRLQEASLPAVIIDNLEIKAGRAAEGASTLTMQIQFYTSPYATGQVATAPAP